MSLPLRIAAPDDAPEYLPARMVNEFVYCPRLFYYMWVEGVFQESADTVAGSHEHKRVDREGKPLPAAEELDEERPFQTRALTLASDRLRVIAKLDLLDAEGGLVTPTDYKKGRPRQGDDGGLEAWPTDRVQLMLQAMLLREAGYRCEEAVVYYAATKQRVRLPVTPEAEAEASAAVEAAWQTARAGVLPPPLVDSPKCNGCSLAPICLPDESTYLRTAPVAEQLPLFPEAETAGRKPMAKEVRRLVSARDELRPVYLTTQGLRVGKSGEALQVKAPAERGVTSRAKETVLQELRLHEICQLNLMGNIQVSTQALHYLVENEIPVCFFSMGGWFYGMAQGLVTKNVFLRQAQYRLAEQGWFCLRLARSLVAGKIRNQRVLLMRNHVEPPGLALGQMKELAAQAEEAESLEQLLGLEGLAARYYFQEFAGMLKGAEPGEESGPAPLRFDFRSRNRRPPRDPVNALLSLGYSMLAKDLTVTAAAVGFDPMLGYYHQPRYGRPALALDLMEPFRPLIVDSAVLQVVNNRMVTPGDFVQSAGSVALKPAGRKAFYQAYEARMDTLVTHPLFEYRVTYRRMLEIQTRLLAKYLEGSVPQYPVFVTR